MLVEPRATGQRSHALKRHWSESTFCRCYPLISIEPPVSIADYSDGHAMSSAKYGLFQIYCIFLSSKLKVVFEFHHGGMGSGITIHV